jgi:hypothetical protein
MYNNPRDPVNFSDLDSDCNYCGEECENDFCNNDCKKSYEHDMFTEKN